MYGRLRAFFTVFQVFRGKSKAKGRAAPGGPAFSGQGFISR